MLHFHFLELVIFKLSSRSTYRSLARRSISVRSPAAALMTERRGTACLSRIADISDFIRAYTFAKTQSERQRRG